MSTDRSKQAAYVRETYSVPEDAVIFLYGGNLGKPQGIPFLVDCLKENYDKPDRFFIICGSGSEYGVIKDFVVAFKPSNVRLINFLPKAEYDALVQGCDMGLIFLDYRFTIPNYPSRMLSYMEQSIPVLSCTDKASDIAETIKDGEFGWSCYSNDVVGFTTCVDEICKDKKEIVSRGEKACKYLVNNFLASRVTKTKSLKQFAKALIKGKDCWLRPLNRDDISLEELTETMCQKQGGYVEFMIHSSELMPGGSPYNPDANSIDRLYNTITIYFDYLTKNGFKGTSLSQYASNLAGEKTYEYI